jgi:transmembrane sensor
MASGSSINELLKRYQTGNCTPEEAARVEAWFEQVQFESNNEAILTTEDEERLVQQLQQHSKFREPAPVISIANKTNRIFRPGRIRVAVWIALMILAAGFTAYLFIKNNTSIHPTSIAFKEIRTGPKERKKILLPDGSIVWLNAASELAWHPDFVHNRQLRLKGEAWFDVVHNRSNPFLVNAGNAITKVYGTAFNISAYPQASELRVALQHGSIGVKYVNKENSKEQMITPGQLLIFHQETNQTEILQENKEDIGGWMNDQLIFRKLPLKDVLAQLERQYGIIFRYSGTIPEQLVTARFEKVPLKKILEHLSFGWDIRFVQHKDTFYVK